jgi:hypothetical protein
MKDELKMFGLVPLFGILGAISTVVMWRVFAITLMDVVPGQLAVLACVVVGLTGPLLLWAMVLLMTGNNREPRLRSFRSPATIGIGLVLATELGFYVPLGFFAIAFQ